MRSIILDTSSGQIQILTGNAILKLLKNHPEIYSSYKFKTLTPKRIQEAIIKLNELLVISNTE